MVLGTQVLRIGGAGAPQFSSHARRVGTSETDASDTLRAGCCARRENPNASDMRRNSKRNHIPVRCKYRLDINI